MGQSTLREGSAKGPSPKKEAPEMQAPFCVLTVLSAVREQLKPLRCLGYTTNPQGQSQEHPARQDCRVSVPSLRLPSLSFLVVKSKFVYHVSLI